MDLFNRDDLKSVLADHSSPCISLFMHAHRGGAEQDPIRWRKQLAEAEERLVEAGWRAADVRDMLAPGRRLLEDSTFWNNQSDGLAAFLAPGSCAFIASHLLSRILSLSAIASTSSLCCPCSTVTAGFTSWP